MLTVGSAALATWDVPELRRLLARIRRFARHYHELPHCLSTLPVEIGASVQPFEDDDLSVPAFLTAKARKRTIRVNALLYGSPLFLVCVLHECAHYLLGRHHGPCTQKVEDRDERDVWLASALIGVSAPLVGQVLDGHESAAAVAWRCRVPEPLVLIRAGLAVVLGERRGSLNDALDLIRRQLMRLEAWIEDMKAWLCRRAWSA